ncbi:hypothetical protein OSTOST_19968 [Ostertagia ostertagi]
MRQKVMQPNNFPLLPTLNRRCHLGTYDPNYQTLANVQGDVFGADKKNAPAGGGGAPPEIKPGAGGMAGTFDPNYQTLAGMNADVFKK